MCRRRLLALRLCEIVRKAHAEAQARALKEFNAEEDKRRIRNGIILTILGCDNLALANGYASKSNPYVVCTFNGVEVGRTPTQHNTLQPRWDDSEYLLYPLGRPDEETQCVAPSHIAGSEQIDDAKESVSTTPVISVCSNDVLSHQLWLILTSDRQCWEKAVDCASRFWNAKDCAGVAPTNCLVVVRVGERASQTKFERGADGSNRLDLALCLSNSVVVTKCEAGTVTSQPISSVEFIRNRELELELWFEDNSSRKCLTSGIAKYTNTSANLCSVELLMRPDRLESTSMVNSEIQQSRVFGEISLHVANSMSAAMAMATDLRKVKLSTVREENFVVGPERPDPAFFVNFAQCTITDESKVGLPVNSYLRFALGGRHCTSGKFETRESHARWSEMIVIPARYAMDTYKEFGVELVRDSPAGEITLIASTTMPWEPVAGQQWNFSSCQLRASNSNRYFTLCYFVMLTRPGEALPPLPVMNSEFPTSHEEVISKSRQRVELKFYNISAENLPQTEYWGTSFGNKQDPYFVARFGSQFATSSIKNGAGLACEWSNEVVELCFAHEEEKDSTMKELILEIWNDNKPAKDVLIGRALLSATSYLSRLGESQSLRLDLFRPNKCGDRRQGNLSFDLVVDVVRDFFADESLANETTKQMNELRVAVIQARKLRAMDRNIYGRLTSSDPIVTLFCAGERKTTSIKTKSLFPVWNEVFSFNVRLDDPNPSAASLTLDVVVDDWDELTANDFMGQLSIPVVDIHDSLPRRQWYPLQGRSNQKRNLGEIELAIQWRYNPDLDFFESVVEADEHLALPPNELLVAVIRGRDLEAVDRGFFGPASSDPFVRLEIDGEERLTTVKKRTLEPVWLEKFCIPAADTDNACLHLTVLDWDITRAADHMGHVRMDLRQLRNRKVSRRWMSLVGAGGEIEVALRWIHNPEMALFDDSVGRDGDKFPGLTPNCLRVSVVRAENLQTSGFGGICDPYVRLSVVDDEEEDGTEGQRRSSTLCRHSSMTMIGREQSDKKSAERCVLSHAETKIERQTLHPRWYQSFKLWCQAPDEDGNDLSDLCPRLELRAFDGSEGAFASVLGSSTIDLGGFLDRKRCRFWTPLKNNSTASNSQIEIVLQWVFDPEFKPDTVARVTQVKLYNVGGACGETVSDLFATFAIAGFNSARAPAAPVVTSQLDVSWEDLDLILYGTRDALTTGHIEMKLWGGGSNKILLGRASLSCNHAVFKRCSENTTVHGAIDMESCEAVVPPPKVEVMLTLCPYTLQFARVMRKRKVPELVFDVFDGDNHGGPDIFLGRAFLRGAQLAAASTVRCVSSCGKYPSPSTQPVKLKLHAKDAYSKNSLKVRGTITVSLLAGRDLEFLRRTRKYEKKAIEDIDDDHTPINSVATIRNLVETVVVDSAWKRMYQGRPLTLHIVGARGLYAPRRIKKKKMADARNALVGLSTKVDDCTALLPSPYVVVNWNSTEACRTETTQTTSNPCWNVQICLQPINHDTDASADVLIFDVYDDEEEHRPQGIEGAFLGRFSLSLAQIWQLRLKSSADLTTEEFRLSRCRQYVANEEEEIGIIPGVRFCLSSMAAADLPDLAFRLTGRRVSPYVLARVWKVEARSSTVRGGGTTLTWKRERVTLMLDERLLREEQLLVQVWMKRAPFADTLLGEATMCLDELVTSRGKAIPTTLELRRPGHRQQGYFSCALSYDIVEAEPGEGSNDTHKEDESFGALRIGVVVNHEAEAAMETVREAQRFARKRRECVDHEKQQQEQERDRASEEIYITHAEEGLALTAAEESEMTTTYYASSSNDEMALIAATSSEDSGYLAQAGVDEATGIPWTRDEWGHRRFFLGFRSEDADSSSS